MLKCLRRCCLHVKISRYLQKLPEVTILQDDMVENRGKSGPLDNLFDPGVPVIAEC